jgi:Cft2 family RNA processing exonuclease
LRYIIHRGQHEVGGMCIEVAADDGTRILLDLGMPLYDVNHADYPFGTPQRPATELLASGVLCDIPGLYA